ncbi:MAG: ketol-acid reductoisomerase [Deltaproteobacteria bacterium]|nr:ketol-acid reductoisomerase [Deltaproteobacteria bacterium]
MAMIKFGETMENVVTREEFPLEKARRILENETIAVLGYGVQGPAQALNLKDNGFNVIVGQRKNSPSWNKALKDGWEENENLFDIAEACKRGTFICYLLSDAGQIQSWPVVKERLSEGKTLCFCHGFGVGFADQTGIVPPSNIDVVLAAPKGSGMSVRRLFVDGRGINSSYAIGQDFSGRALEKICAYGIGIGSAYLFETTFQKEVCSDLVGERGVLLGALAGIIEAQYNVLRRNGHTPSEAFNESVEELTQSLVPLIGENGMDWMYSNCSTTAQRGALDWLPKFRAAVEPVFEDLYRKVKSGEEARIVIEANNRPDYRQRLDAELSEMRNMEIWRAGEQVRKLRP